MTKYRVALNKDRTMWFHAGADTPAETYIDIEWAETVAQQLRNGCYPDAHVVDVQPEPVKVDAHLAANPEPEPEPKYRSPMRLQRDQLREELKRAWDAIPSGIASRSDSVSAAVGKLAYVYKDNQHVADNYRAALRALPEEFRGYWALPDSVAKLAKAYEQFQAENAKLKAKVEFLGNQLQLSAEDMKAAMAKPEPVADAEIRSTLRDMTEYAEVIHEHDRDAVLRWHDTLQAVGADLVVARESLEQVTKVKDEMSYGRDTAVKVMRSIGEDLNQCREALDTVTKERDALHATEGALIKDLEVAIKERDEARAELEECKMVLPEELRGGSVVLGISALIRSRTYAREQASQYAKRCAEARDERDALNSRLSKKQAAIAKALEL